MDWILASESHMEILARIQRVKVNKMSYILAILKRIRCFRIMFEMRSAYTYL